MTMRIVIAVLILVLILVGGYFVWSTSSGGEDTPETPPETANEPVQAQEVTIGTGKIAEPGKQISILYEGRLENGTIFDSSAAHDNQPLTFVLGAQGIISGFQIGVNGMREGGERTFGIPPSLGYGAQEVKDANGNVVIPANSKLIFNVKLVEVSDAPTE